MSSRAIAEVTRTWNNHADAYNDFYTRYPAERREQWRGVYRQALESLFTDGHGPLRVLDVGVGTGFGAVLLAELGHQVTGIDLSVRMLEHARQEADRHEVQLRLLRHGAHDAPELDQQFDLVTSRFVLWTLPEPQRALTGWRQVLRPGGAVLISDSLWHSARTSWQKIRTSLKPGEDHWDLLRLLRNYLGMGPVPYWKGLSLDEGRTLLSNAGFAAPHRFDHLLPPHPDSDALALFILGAHNPAPS